MDDICSFIKREIEKQEVEYANPYHSLMESESFTLSCEIIWERASKPTLYNSSYDMPGIHCKLKYTNHTSLLGTYVTQTIKQNTYHQTEHIPCHAQYLHSRELPHLT